MDGGLVLGIELSQREGGVAVVGPEGAVHARPVSGGRRDRDELLPAIQETLAEAGGSVRDLTLVAVDIGPGGFTGLRISTATGQAIAEGVGVPAMGIPGAEVAAATFIDHQRSRDSATGIATEIAVVSAVRDGSGWETRLVRDPASPDWRVRGTPEIRHAPPEDVELVLADEHLPSAWRETLLARGVAVVDPRFEAAVLARLALEVRGDGVRDRKGWVYAEDPAKLLPIYPRVPEAVRLWQERSAR